MTEGTKQYEISVMLAKEEAYPGVIALLKERGAEITEENQPKRVNLAYPINREEVGFFAWCIAALPMEKISGIQKELEMDPGVLRALIITPPVPPKSERRAPRLREVKRESPRDGEAPAIEYSRPRAHEEKRGETLTNELLEKKL